MANDISYVYIVVIYLHSHIQLKYIYSADRQTDRQTDR